MKYIGLFALICGGVMLVRAYSKRERERLLLCEGFLAFLLHIRIKIGCYLCPTESLADGFDSPPLRDCGFIDALKKHRRLDLAWSEVSREIALAEDEKRTLQCVFSSFGEGYMADGVRLIDTASDELSRTTEILRKKVPENLRLASLVSATLLLGLIILFI